MLQQFLQEFGYFALFLGTFFEGETILVLAGFLAFRGYMDLKLVMIVAFLGSYAGDQLWYFLGRKHGRKLLARKPRWQLMGDKALEHIRRHPDIWVLSFRFVYGLRTVMPVSLQYRLTRRSPPAVIIRSACCRSSRTPSRYPAARNGRARHPRTTLASRLGAAP